MSTLNVQNLQSKTANAAFVIADVAASGRILLGAPQLAFS